MLNKVMSVCALGLGLALSPAVNAQQQSDRAAELKQIAAQMKPFSLHVLGLATGTSEWGFLDKPFWLEAVKELSAGKVSVQLNSMSELNLQGGDAFKMISQGMFDVGDLVANYGAGEVNQLDALDLAGVAGAFAEQGKVMAAYAPVLADALKARFGLETLAVMSSTAQMFYCRPEVRKLDDLKGKKVRLSSATIADLVGGLGGVPVTMAFAEAVPAVQRGVVDCIVTGTMSANTSKLFEVANYVFPLTVGWAPRVRIVSSKLWKSLDDTQKLWMKKATEYYVRDMSDPIQLRNTEQGLWCLTGSDRCTLAGQFGVTKSQMVLGEVSSQDQVKVREVVQSRVLPSFAKSCGDKCAASWQDTVGKVTGLKMTK